MSYMTKEEALKVKAEIEKKIKEMGDTQFYVENKDTVYPKWVTEMEGHDPLDEAEILFSEKARDAKFNWRFAGIEIQEDVYYLFGWGNAGDKVREIMKHAVDFACELTGKDLSVDWF